MPLGALCKVLPSTWPVSETWGSTLGHTGPTGGGLRKADLVPRSPSPEAVGGTESSSRRAPFWHVGAPAEDCRALRWAGRKDRGAEKPGSFGDPTQVVGTHTPPGPGDLASDHTPCWSISRGRSPWGHPAHLPPGARVPPSTAESSPRCFPAAPCPVLGVPAAPCPPPAHPREGAVGKPLASWQGLTCR